MNLLTDHWIPVHHQGRFRHISLSDLLCTEADWQISLPRDDMEMAALQLLISLTQILLMPADKKALRERIRIPISQDEYLAAIAAKKEWFDLDHPDHPFMQRRGVKANKRTDMAKLFAGLSGATYSVFVNEPGLATRLCSSCALIGLFNQASNCPSFGGGKHGGFKFPLRNVAITTLVQGRNLRDTIWNNVLPQQTVKNLMPWYSATKKDEPNWVDSVNAGDTVHAHTIGLLRGLFWQPAHIELELSGARGICNCCGRIEQTLYCSFKTEQFGYKSEGLWPHPHSPRIWGLNKGEKKDEKFASFRTIAPAWSLLTQFVIEKENDKAGHSPAPVVTQAKELCRGQPLFLLVGGYHNKQASIVERRHELINLAREWEGYPLKIERIVGNGLAYKTVLRNKLWGFCEATGFSFYKERTVKKSYICDLAESNFYKSTENLVHDLLREMNFKESKQAFVVYHNQLSKTTRTIFEQVTRPYQQNPAMIRALTVARRGLEKAMKSLREE